MKYSDEYQDKQVINGLAKKIKEMKLSEEVNIMEVCGTHTMSIYKNGIKSLLPDKIKLISGPGCPVCVTPETYINKAIFLAIGFETTIPTIALSIKKAKILGLKNYYLLQSLKTMPPVLKQLLMDEEIKIDGFILPGHVSAIIGSGAFDFLSKEYNIAGVVAGFEAGDIILGLYRLCTMLKNNKTEVENLYSRLVNYNGNKKAVAVNNEIFRPIDSYWRGIGMIEDSGLELGEEYEKFSAEARFQFGQIRYGNNEGCICGDILKGKKEPTDCKLFSSVCTPLEPVGPCMVSREGTCAAYYRYRVRTGRRM